MGRFVQMKIMLPLALLIGACSHPTVLVSVPPRMDLRNYPTLGIVDFTSASERALGARAARQFQEQVQSAQPGTRFIELGDRDAVLAAVGAKTLDVSAWKKIGDKYGVAAVFVGELTYSDPSVNVKVTDLNKLQGGMRAEVKGDISSRLFETASGASVPSSSLFGPDARNVSLILSTEPSSISRLAARSLGNSLIIIAPDPFPSEPSALMRLTLT